MLLAPSPLRDASSRQQVPLLPSLHATRAKHALQYQNSSRVSVVRRNASHHPVVELHLAARPPAHDVLQPGLHSIARRRASPRHARRCAPPASTAATSPPTTSRWTALGTFLFNNFVPIGLILAILVGYACYNTSCNPPGYHLTYTRTLAPGPGAHAAKYGVLRIATTGIFFISGLGLKRGETQRALAAWGAVLYGMVAILLITPLLGILALRVPLQPAELAFGLAVFCCMPTTLSSGVSLTAVCAKTLLSMASTCTPT